MSNMDTSMQDEMQGEEVRGGTSLALRTEQQLTPRDHGAVRTPQVGRPAATETRVRQSANVTELMMSFARAQMEFPVVPKNKTAHIEPFRGKPYTYNYADLADAQRAVNPVLQRHELAFMMIPTRGSIVGRLIHAPTGQWVEGDLGIVAPDTRGGVQALGSALTYERRYLFAAMLNLVLDEDDDGTAAQGLAQAREEQQTKVPGELAKHVAKLAATGPAARSALIEAMTKNRETPTIQEAALRMFDALTKPREREPGDATDDGACAEP